MQDPRSRPAFPPASVWVILALAFWLPAAPALGQERAIPAAPDRRPDEGEGPYQTLVLHRVTVIDGTGAPARGPVDVVIAGNRIREIRESRRRSPAPADSGAATRVIDGKGWYVLPGFVDVHAHIGGAGQATPAEYVFKLWMAHGVTSIREPGSGNGLEFTLSARARSAANRIVAPRIFSYALVGMGWDRPLHTPEDARAWVDWLAGQGADGIKIRDTYDPAIVAAILDEAGQRGLGTAAHLTQVGVARMNALDAARAGLTTLEHWYGLPEALFADRTVQDFPPGYNYDDEYDRFGQAGRLWRQAAPPGSEKREAVLNELLGLGLTLVPTMTIYEANRDVMRARRAEWHDAYTLPSLWRFFQPSRDSHGSYWYHWTTADEIAWKQNFRIWMNFLNEYKNRGGHVCTGSDSGFIYKLYGFGYIRELELLQEAGFHPLEVIRAATLCGAETIYRPKGTPPEFGTVEAGKLADLVVVEENPLEDLKVLYGTGTIRLNEETGRVEKVGGVKYTIKDRIVYDARRLLADVARMVAEAKATAGASSSSN
ncbi:MAG: amidohydrolase family protein [Gemmatimonadota bacterium]